jgi:hypothetical protein
MSSFVWLKELYFIDFEWAFTDPEETVVLYPKSVRSSAIAAGGVLRRLGRLFTEHRSLARNTAEWPLSTLANAYSRPKADCQVFAIKVCYGPESSSSTWP